MDEKFDILRHPNVTGTTDGKAERFHHGAVLPSSASIAFDFELDPVTLTDPIIPSGDYELLSEEDLEALFNPKEDKPHEEE